MKVRVDGDIAEQVVNELRRAQQVYFYGPLGSWVLDVFKRRLLAAVLAPESGVHYRDARDARRHALYLYIEAGDVISPPTPGSAWPPPLDPTAVLETEEWDEIARWNGSNPRKLRKVYQEMVLDHLPCGGMGPLPEA